MAILVPLTGYLIVDHYGKNVVHVPPYLIAERVDTVVKDGKTTYDTVFHKVQDFTLTNQLGEQVNLKNAENRILIVNFFFTSCPVICPNLIKNLKRVQDTYNKNDTLIQIISLTVDPARDTVQTLKKYADKHNIDPKNWWLLTGDKKEIYDLARHEFFVNALEGTGGPDDFIHTEKFVVIDKDRYIRGYYNGLDSNDVRRMVNDIAVLHIAKDKKKPGLLKRLFSSGN
ncbi:SCO family protein [Chitinophaga barathri]|uniref:SCO family protein n=1 Tax=Chitinophaga barathri TaxID=1647451 RepID=UPI0013C494A7|nr:SCO family protein [Chitinophaga barathri]